MCKRLFARLGLLCFVFAVTPGFADQFTTECLCVPVISSLPDIIISDAEPSQTIDNNLFVFSNAFDLDEYVPGLSTTHTQNLRWSFIQSSGPAIEINGVGSNTSGDVLEPGAFDIRMAGRYASFRNVDWSPLSSPPPYPDPPATRADSVIWMFVSNGTSTDSQLVRVTSIDNDAAGDRLAPSPVTSYQFATNEDGWTWFGASPEFLEPDHIWGAGSLQITEHAGASRMVFGSWESPKDPAVAASPRFGTILRARYHVRSPSCGARCPGFRMRAITTHVREHERTWVPDFLSQDFNANLTVNYFTPDSQYVEGREAGLQGTVYEVLSYPQQTQSLMSTPTITYFTWDLADLDASFTDDAGTLFLDGVSIDMLDRPEPGKGVAEPALSYSDFSSWSGDVTPIPGGSYVHPVFYITGADVSLTVAPGCQWFSAAALSPAVPLQPYRYYRSIFTVSSTATPGGDFGPTIRAGFASSRFVWSVDKDLPGGGLLSAIGPAMEEYEVWAVGPSADGGTSQTEPIHLRFGSWLAHSNTGFPFGKNVSGTVRCSEVDTESFSAP